MRLSDGRIRKLRRSSDDAAAAHALTFSCFRRQPFLSRERTCLWLAEALERARRDHPLDLWAYVFMPEHVHLILLPRGPLFRLRALLAAIKLPVSRRALAFVTQNAPHFLAEMRDLQPNGRLSHRFCSAAAAMTATCTTPARSTRQLTTFTQTRCARGWSSARNCGAGPALVISPARAQRL